MSVTRIIKGALFAALFTAGTLNIAYAKPDQKVLTEEDVEKIVRAYILKNPQIIQEAIVNLRQMQMAEQQKRQEEGLKKYTKEIFNASHDYVAGNPKGDVTIVEFFDYNCGFCRRAFKDVLKVIEKDKNVRVVFKELPIFGAPSEAAARAAIASIKQNKYFEFHSKMLLDPGNANEAKALKIAKELGMDIKKLKADMKSEETTKAIAANSRLANNIGLEGTPLYIVGNEIIPGAPEDLTDQILDRIEKIRAAKKKS